MSHFQPGRTIADRIQSAFYLTLDADVICTRTVGYSDLIIDGRAICDRYKHPVHAEWYTWAERVLGFRRSGWVHDVTPALLSKDAMIRLHVYLEGRVSRALRLVAAPLPPRSIARTLLVSWRSFLLRNFPWTEYTLYNTFLEGTNQYEKYHVQTDDRVLTGNSVWTKDGLFNWNPQQSFCGRAAFFFSVVQSNTGISAAEVWAKVRPFLEAPSA